MHIKYQYLTTDIQEFTTNITDKYSEMSFCFRLICPGLGLLTTCYSVATMLIHKALRSVVTKLTQHLPQTTLSQGVGQKYIILLMTSLDKVITCK